MIGGVIKPSSPIKVLDSKLSSDFLAALATFRERGDKTSKANSDQESDILKAKANKTFLEKNFENKSNSESDFNIDPKSKDDDDNDNFIATSLQDSQESEKPVNNNKFANKYNLSF